MNLRQAIVTRLKGAAYAVMPKPQYEVTTDFGRISIPYRDEYSKRWILRNKRNLNCWHEPSLSWLILLAGRIGKTTLFDVGAHMGYFSIIHAARSGNRSFSFELDKDNFSALSRIVDGIPDITIFHSGVSDLPGSIILPVSGRQNPKANLLQDTTLKGENCTVEIVTIDGMVRRCAIGIDILKIDVEGAEYHVLKGAHDALQTLHPVVAVEVHPGPLSALGNLTPVDLVGLMANYGYEAFEFEAHRGTTCAPMRVFDPARVDGRDFDIIFIHPDSACDLVLMYNESLNVVRDGNFPSIERRT